MIKDFAAKYSCCVIPARKEYAFWHAVAHVVFCVDCVFTKSRGPGKRCDEFVFFELNRNLTGIYVVERKDSASINPKEIYEQLQGGADFITKFLSKDPALAAYRSNFEPVLVARDGIRQSMLRKLVEKTICLRGQPKHIKYVKIYKKLPKIH